MLRSCESGSMVGSRKRAQVNYAEDAGCVDRACFCVLDICAAPCASDACRRPTHSPLGPAGQSLTRMMNASRLRSSARRRCVPAITLPAQRPPRRLPSTCQGARNSIFCLCRPIVPRPASSVRASVALLKPQQTRRRHPCWVGWGCGAAAVRPPVVPPVGWLPACLPSQYDCSHPSHNLRA